jgi:DUF4097 and DUF4098 domain-containing protein YvlB
VVDLKTVLQVAGLAVLALTAPLVLAQEITGTLAAVKNLRVKVDTGSVVVRGGDQQAINYVLHTNYRNSNDELRHEYKVTSYVKGDTAWIIGNRQGGHMRHFGGEFAITVPHDMALVKVESGGGGIDISGIAGRAELETGGGKIRVDNIGGSVVAQTGGDSIDAGTVQGDVELTTGGGSINVRDVKGKMKAETGGGNVYVMSVGQDAVVEAGGGNVQIKKCQGRVKASTGGGNIDLGDLGGPADIQTGGGSIHLASAKGRVGANTGAGTIELYGVPSARVETGAGGIVLKLVNGGGVPHDSDLETGTGDITVYIAPDVAINVRASVDMGNGHRITSDFPDIHISTEGGDWGPKTLMAEGKLNGGGAWLKVHTSTGDICLKKTGH